MDVDLRLHFITRVRLKVNADQKKVPGGLEARKVRKTVAVYLSSALTAIGIVKLFTEVYNLLPVVFPRVVTLLACGVGSALVSPWCHAAEGHQKFTGRELLLDGVFVAIAAAFSYPIAGMPRPGRAGANLKSIAALPSQNTSDRRRFNR